MRRKLTHKQERAKAKKARRAAKTQYQQQKAWERKYEARWTSRAIAATERIGIRNEQFLNLWRLLNRQGVA